jgi:hypothetical protein
MVGGREKKRGGGGGCLMGVRHIVKSTRDVHVFVCLVT